MVRLRQFGCHVRRREFKLIKRELNDELNGPEGQQDSESVPDRECSAQENEIRNTLASVHHRLAEYIEILLGEMVA